VLTPLLLELGCHPQVVAATTQVLLFCTTGSSTAVFASMGDIPWGSAGVAMGVGFTRWVVRRRECVVSVSPWAALCIQLDCDAGVRHSASLSPNTRATRKRRAPKPQHPSTLVGQLAIDRLVRRAGGRGSVIVIILAVFFGAAAGLSYFVAGRAIAAFVRDPAAAMHVAGICPIKLE
jgi:hypothetical protein